MPVSTEVRVHRLSGAAPPGCRERVWSYAAGFSDGRDQALDGKPPLCAASQYGNGFYDGWRSVRYPDGTAIAKG
jgi:hypothetical protein